MNKRTKNLLIILAVVVIAAILFFILRGGGEEADLVSVVVGGEETTVVEIEVLTLLNTLRSIDFNTELFEDERFLSLVDFSIELQPQPKGRPNPFAPIGVDPEPIRVEPVEATPSSSEMPSDAASSENTSESTVEDELDAFEEEFDFGEFSDF